MAETDEVSIVSIGLSGVGKSYIVVRYIQRVFPRYFEPTTSKNHFHKNLKIGEKWINIDITDTGNSFSKYLCNYTKNDPNKAVMLVYAIDDKNSFDELKKYIDEEINRIEKDKLPMFFVVGNKCDLEDNRKVNKKEGESFANSINASFFEVSAKNQNLVDNLFMDIIEKCTHIDISTLNKKPERQGNDEQCYIA